MLKGTNVSDGYGIGKVVTVRELNIEYTPRTGCEPETEKARYAAALEKFCEKTEAMAEKVKTGVGEKESEILLGHIMMIKDPYMTSQIESKIESGMCAESSFEAVCDMFIMVFSSADDELTNQRAADVRDIKTAVLAILLGKEETDISAVPPGTVLVARDLTPSMTASINRRNIAGIITEVGGRTSHSAILARAMEIPAVLSVPDALGKLSDGETVIVDGCTGEIYENPTQSDIDTYTQRRVEFIEERKALAKFIGKKTVTADGREVELVSNIGKPDEANKARECDAEGVGLFRTEFLFMDRTSAPSEEEQFAAYKKAALIMKNRPVIIRTLDVGGDKAIPYLKMPKEDNPFLGFRAIRYCLKNKDLYSAQLRALLRASAFGDIRIMVPLVTGVEELRAVKAMLCEIEKEFDESGILYNKSIKVGVMIETPAASLIADILAKEADFFSIGTNDLTQYTMVVDRGNADVSYLYSTYHPAVLRSIRRIIACAHEAGIPAGMCGEAAADKKMIPLLISFGLDEFSVSPTSVLSVRKTVSEWSKEKADALTERVMSLETEEEISAELDKI